MKKCTLLASALLCFMLSAFSQSNESDILYPYKKTKMEDKSYQITFDNSSIPLYTTSKVVMKIVDEAIKKESPIEVIYNESNLAIVSVKEKEIDQKEKFLEKFDTLMFVNFEYKDSKNFKSNENKFMEQFDFLPQLNDPKIPLDSVKVIFDFFVKNSCETLHTCSTEKPCITYDYKTNGCNARAHWMKKILEEKFGYSCRKIFSEGSLIAQNGGTCGGQCVSWGWHVAPLVEGVDKNGAVTELILDPSLFNKPVLREEWENAQKTKCAATGRIGRITKVTVRPSQIYTPNGSTDVNYANTYHLLYKFCKKCH